MSAAKLLGMTMCIALPLAASAQPGRILTGKDLNESALVEALTPEPGVKTRSIRVLRDEPAASPKSPAASLLITFETDSAELTQRARSALDIVGRALNSNKLAEFAFDVEGHADPRGGHEYNLRLSQERAASVVEYLAANHNIGRQRLKPVGKGDTELMNRSRPYAQENRRVTIRTVVR